MILGDGHKDSDGTNLRHNRKLPFLEDIESYPPWSYDRFMANMTNLIKQKRNQKQLHSLMSSAFNPLNSLPVISDSSVKRVLVITYFRAGSSFLGDLLQQNWKSFFTFEPLHYMSDGVRIDDQRVEEANHLIENIFRCDFQSIKTYVQWVQKTRNQFLFKWNKFLWGVCRFRHKSCFDPNFIHETCLRAKVHVMKVVRLHIHHLESLLPKLLDLNVSVIYLVRDPRGTLKSRQNMIWCSQKTNCSDINYMCSEMRDDISSFKRLKEKYPSKLTLIKYEDLATDPTNSAKLLLKRTGIPYSATVRRFLQTHTNSTISESSKRNPYTTTRNSKSIAFEWIQTLNKSDIFQVQNICGDLLRELNYKFIANDTQTIPSNKTKLN